MKKVCIIRHAYYPADPRVRKEAEALARAGCVVDVLCLREPGQPKEERIRDVNVYRVPVQHLRKGRMRYILEYSSSFFFFAALITLLHLRKRYDVVQVNTMPDFLVFATLAPKLLGVKIVLDMHECMPEIYTVKYRLDQRSLLVKLLEWLEQLSMLYADQVITCNQQMKEIFVSRGAPPSKISIVLNSADDQIFRPLSQHSEPSSCKDGLVLISHGSIEERYGLDTAIKAVNLLKDHIPKLRLEIFGDGEFKEDLIELVQNLSLEDYITFKGYVPIRRLVRALNDADIGLVTIRQHPAVAWVHTFKMFELVAMRKPIVITRSPSVEAYFDESCLTFFESGNEEDLARAVFELYNDPPRCLSMVESASRVYERYKWSAQAPVYCSLIESLSESH